MKKNSAEVRKPCKWKNGQETNFTLKNKRTKWRREPMQNMSEFLVKALCDRE